VNCIHQKYVAIKQKKIGHKHFIMDFFLSNKAAMSFIKYHQNRNVRSWGSSQRIGGMRGELAELWKVVGKNRKVRAMLESIQGR
jgi:hypothetical protein